MAYRNGTYVAFHAQGTNLPGKSDMDYYNLMTAWSAKSENDGKGFVTDQPLGAEDRMAESEGFRLTDVAEVRERGDVPHLAQELRLAAALEVFFQLDGAVEMIFDRTFAPSGDDDDVFDSGGDRFFHRILNQWLVDERQHFFRRRFRRGKEASTKACGGNHGFAHFEA